MAILSWLERGTEEQKDPGLVFLESPAPGDRANSAEQRQEVWRGPWRVESKGVDTWALAGGLGFSLGSAFGFICDLW